MERDFADEHEICNIFGQVNRLETMARGGIRSSIRLAYIHNLFGEEKDAALDYFDALPKNKTLSDLYGLLDEAQRDKLREMVENPSVRVCGEEGRDFLNDPKRNILRRLEGGIYVGSPDETQIKRTVGTKVFNPTR